MPISFDLVHTTATNRTHHIDRSALTDSINAGAVQVKTLKVLISSQRVGKGKLLESQFIEKGQACGLGP
uniref:Uncharacterized protein n=1 Tax=Salix viminalis TaxID=40686 RepID=A0A6N2LUD8_SALVM